MATWVAKATGMSPRNETVNHVLDFGDYVPAEGSFLELWVSSPSPMNGTPAGWQERARVGTNSGLTLLTLDGALGTETDLSIVLSHPNFSVVWALYEYLPGTQWGGVGEQDEASNPWNALAGMSGENLTIKIGQAFGVHGVPVADPNPHVDPPPDDFYRDFQQYVPVGDNDGAGLAVHARDVWDGDALGSMTVSLVLGVDTGLSGQAAQSRIAAWLLPAAPVVLDTPVITSVETTPTTADGASDGTMTVAWDPVDGAGSYDVAVAIGHGATDGFDIGIDPNATSPHTVTGLPSGAYTVGIIAVPPEV
jgi:hypothetical protein